MGIEGLQQELGEIRTQVPKTDVGLVGEVEIHVIFVKAKINESLR